MRQTKLILILLALALALIILAIAASFQNNNNLTYVACDVGQGDAHLLISGNNEILIDGGPGNKVLDCLGRHVPFFDREIELVVLTHPQSDHFGGLTEVVKRYKVKKFLGNSLEVGNQDYRVLKDLLGGGGVDVIRVSDVTKLRLGEIYLDILHPTNSFYEQNTSKTSEEQQDDNDKLNDYKTSENLNDFSVVIIATYKNFNILFTGDIEQEISDLVAEKLASSNMPQIEILKVPHHGSVNGMTQRLLNAVDPKIAILSVGKNQWGHPRPEILEILRGKGVYLCNTLDNGDCVVKSSGESYSTNFRSIDNKSHN